ncbi:hypothetical protein CN684_07545 [Bacillus wiedmannii]|uniref:Restriction endonuclease type II EcoRII C-terminal domain-containing protein n=1 Tax=Bacillus wiedmannii TaxID=1890302 RepID=A0A2A7W278_9BACI|nr:hypothetical protein CN684_07545 [Bacillus wiedmannii]PHC64068.1 hypothetical protein COF35_23920 [Bacillus wiedmannii]
MFPIIKHIIFIIYDNKYVDRWAILINFSSNRPIDLKSLVFYFDPFHLNLVIPLQVPENKSNPDFLFFSILCYKDPKFQENNLTILGIKSTCKDR